jgi:hypothetical protein
VENLTEENLQHQHRLDRELAKVFGFGNPAWNAVWTKCPYEVRRYILWRLVTNVPFLKALFNELSDQLIHQWATIREAQGLPEEIQPYIYLAFDVRQHGAYFYCEKLEERLNQHYDTKPSVVCKYFSVDAVFHAT